MYWDPDAIWDDAISCSGDIEAPNALGEGEGQGQGEGSSSDGHESYDSPTHEETNGTTSPSSSPPPASSSASLQRYNGSDNNDDDDDTIYYSGGCSMACDFLLHFTLAAFYLFILM